jgi:hypothetical protein
MHHLIEDSLRLACIGSRRNQRGECLNDSPDSGEAVAARGNAASLRRQTRYGAHEVVSGHADIDLLGHQIGSAASELI